MNEDDELRQRDDTHQGITDKSERRPSMVWLWALLVLIALFAILLAYGGQGWFSAPSTVAQ